jgi:MFS family permease
MSSGVFLTYFTVQQGLGLTTLTYGFLFGLGVALAYAPPMGVAMRWFPRQKGLVNGIIVGGFGLGAFIFNQVRPGHNFKKNFLFKNYGIDTGTTGNFFAVNCFRFSLVGYPAIFIIRSDIRQVKSGILPDTGCKKRPDVPAGYPVHSYFSSGSVFNCNIRSLCNVHLQYYPVPV